MVSIVFSYFYSERSASHYVLIFQVCRWFATVYPKINGRTLCLIEWACVSSRNMSIQIILSCIWCKRNIQEYILRLCLIIQWIGNINSIINWDIVTKRNNAGRTKSRDNRLIFLDFNNLPRQTSCEREVARLLFSNIKALFVIINVRFRQSLHGDS
jgi:hypothetical protein